jgi:hypothetical protein
MPAACLSLYLLYICSISRPGLQMHGLGRVCVAAGGVLIGDKRSRRAVTTMLELEGGPISLFIHGKMGARA